MATTDCITVEERYILAEHWLNEFAESELTYLLYGDNDSDGPRNAGYSSLRCDQYLSAMTPQERLDVTHRVNRMLGGRYGAHFEVFKSASPRFSGVGYSLDAVKRCFCSQVLIHLASSSSPHGWFLVLELSAKALLSCEEDVPPLVAETLRLQHDKTYRFVAGRVQEYLAGHKGHADCECDLCDPRQEGWQ